MAAAVVNQGFCALLLVNPEAALAKGYNGAPFRLAPEERRILLSIRATTLRDFASQLVMAQNAAGYNKAAAVKDSFERELDAVTTYPRPVLSNA